MKRTIGRLCAVGALLASGVLFAPPAAAEPCRQFVLATLHPEVPSHTVGVLGQPVATTPAFETGACLSGDYDPSALPTYRLEENGTNFALYLVQPAGSVGVHWVQVDFTLDGEYHEHHIPVGAGGGGGGQEFCLVYKGARPAPSGCAVFIES